MADFSRVVNRTAPADYLDPAAFFPKNYTTRGMKELLKAVCLRVSGKGGEVSSIIRLGAQYGGAKPTRSSLLSTQLSLEEVICARPDAVVDVRDGIGDNKDVRCRLHRVCPRRRRSTPGW